VNALGWILIAIAAWLTVSAVVGPLVGRSFRDRDQQSPREHTATTDETTEH
jgi:hypothetical protein